MLESRHRRRRAHCPVATARANRQVTAVGSGLDSDRSVAPVERLIQRRIGDGVLGPDESGHLHRQRVNLFDRAGHVGRATRDVGDLLELTTSTARLTRADREMYRVKSAA